MTKDIWKITDIISNFREIVERLVFNEMFKLLIENNLISFNQSCFQLGHSCINQFLTIAYKIYIPFDDGFEVRVVFHKGVS